MSGAQRKRDQELPGELEEADADSETTISFVGLAGQLSPVPELGGISFIRPRVIAPVDNTSRTVGSDESHDRYLMREMISTVTRHHVYNLGTDARQSSGELFPCSVTP